MPYHSSGGLSADYSGLVTLNRTQQLVGATGPFSHVHNDTTATYTPHMQIPALAPFYGFRLGFSNRKAVDISIGACKTSPAPQSLLNSNSGSLSWSQITFGGSATTTITAAASAARVNDQIPTLALSDYQYTASVARTDDSTKGPLIQVVTSFSTIGSAVNIDATTFPEFLTATGLEYASRIATSDIATNPAAASSTPSATGTWVCPQWVEFLYSVPSRTIVSVGDSRERGETSATTTLGWNSIVNRLCYQRNSSSFVWSGTSFAVTGQQHTASYNIGLSVVAALRPTYLVSQVYSANDTISQAAIDRAWAETVALSRECDKYGVVHIVQTCPPFNLSSGNDAFRVAINARLRASNMLCSDIATPLETPGDQKTLLSTYDCGDHIHLTDAGYDVCRNVLQLVVPYK